ncbi:MAG: hypothetical protein GY714_31555 [Desulfobacterales bacterium]|nr:hypothetical protein [Desulfobacterales bacterium]
MEILKMLILSIIFLACSDVSENKYTYNIPLNSGKYKLEFNVDDKKNKKIEDFSRNNHSFRIAYSNDSTYSFRFVRNNLEIVFNIEDNNIRNYSISSINGSNKYKIVRHINDKYSKKDFFSGMEETQIFKYIANHKNNKLNINIIR